MESETLPQELSTGDKLRMTKKVRSVNKCLWKRGTAMYVRWVSGERWWQRNNI